MNLYLNYAQQHLTEPRENDPVGSVRAAARTTRWSSTPPADQRPRVRLEVPDPTVGRGNLAEGNRNNAAGPAGSPAASSARGQPVDTQPNEERSMAKPLDLGNVVSTGDDLKRKATRSCTCSRQTFTRSAMQTGIRRSTRSPRVLRLDLSHAQPPQPGAGCRPTASRKERQGDPAVGVDLRRRQDAHTDHDVAPGQRSGQFARPTCRASSPRRQPAALSSRVAGLCFDKLDVETGCDALNLRRCDGSNSRSLLAYQVAGDEGLKLLHAEGKAEERNTPPAENTLTQLPRCRWGRVRAR